MKSHAYFVTLLMTLAWHVKAAEPPIPVAVLEFHSSGDDTGTLGAKMAALVTAQLSTDDRLLTVERTELDAVLSEQEFGLSGTINADSAAKVGHLTGAKVLVTGSVIRDGAQTLYVAKLISTETSRVLGATASAKPQASLVDTATELARIIADRIATNRTAMLAVPVKQADVIARIKSSLKPGPLPVITVHIPEEHLSRPVIDPAAETELLKILKACGFTILDAKSGKRADYAIEGEAFSEAGLRKGNLVSCKARLEVKLRDLSSGELLAVDRQVGIGIDLSEHVAAKAALEQAARDVAGRLLAPFTQ